MDRLVASIDFHLDELHKLSSAPRNHRDEAGEEVVSSVGPIASRTICARLRGFFCLSTSTHAQVAVTRRSARSWTPSLSCSTRSCDNSSACPGLQLGGSSPSASSGSPR